MNILRAHDAQRHTTPNATVIPLATPSLGAQQISVIRQEMGPGHANPAHAQTHEEVMVMLDGQVTVTVDGGTTDLQAGDTLTIPAMTVHSIENPGPQGATWLIVSPTGMGFLGADGQVMTPDWAK
ncbi:cupin domain-containing protein [Deinococcus sp.]|uniref:cupin domain-containing protein n=1 Tax=Deinococcus sp. TaxID=47478 RepID=UPI0028699694|nr:cupin domain-containing protein [Deinococcus sp.]